MTTSDVLRPDGTDYDSFLFAELGENSAGGVVTVISALARLGLEPWTEAQELADLGTEDAENRLNAHLAAITDIPALAIASQSKAVKLVSLLPKRTSPSFAHARQSANTNIPKVSFFWVALALLGIAALARVYFLAQVS